MTKRIFLTKGILLILFFLSYNLGFSQDSVKVKKESPILYGEIVFGFGAFNNNASVICDIGLHYQKKKHLWTLKYTENYAFSIEPLFLTPVTPFFLPIDKGKNSEVSILYGIRGVEDWASLSFSAGVSINDFSLRYRQPNDEIIKTNDTYIGFPYELSVKLFKAKKRRFRVFYWLIPVSKPTAFGRSIGFKIFGNFSKRKYYGVGLSYGFGWHRKY